MTNSISIPCVFQARPAGNPRSSLPTSRGGQVLPITVAWKSPEATASCPLAVFAPLHILSHLFFGQLQGSPNWSSCLFSCSLSVELSFAATGILKYKSEQLPACFCDHFACPHYPQIKSKFSLPLKHTPSHTTRGKALQMGHASVLCLWALPFLLLLGMSLLLYTNSK